MKHPTDRDTLPGVLRDLDRRLARQERHTHHSVGTVLPGFSMAASTDYNNATRIGTDGGLYTNEIVARETAPRPVDFGGYIPLWSIWLQTGDLVTTCIPWSDDFERADGPLDGDWETWPVPGYSPMPINIESGAAVCADADLAVGTYGLAQWTHPAPGPQFVELVVSRFDQTSPLPGNSAVLCDYTMQTHRTMTNTDAIECYVVAYSPSHYAPGAQPNGAMSIGFYMVDPDTGSFDSFAGSAEDWPMPAPWGANGEVTLRLDDDGAGNLAVTINGEPFATATAPRIPAGDRIGWGMTWRTLTAPPAPPPAHVTPRIERVTVCGGPLL